jgi:uncharacterized protein YbbK (DUF523 family)
MEAVSDTVDHRHHFTIGENKIVIDDRRTVRNSPSCGTQKVVIGNVREIYRGTEELRCYHFLRHDWSPF